MSFRMIKLYMNILVDKIKMKYITHEMVNEDIFPLWGNTRPYKRVNNIDAIIERLG